MTASRRCIWVLLALVFVHGAAVVGLAYTTPWTVDEYHYQLGALGLSTKLSFEWPELSLHGPLPFFGMQLASCFGIDFDPPAPPSAHNLFYGRLGMLPFALAAAGLLAVLAWRLIGRWGAVFAVALYTLHPVVLGHACLMTADTAFAAGTLLTLVSVERYLRKPNLMRLLLVGGSLAVALATKYLALLLIPVLALALLLGRDHGAREARVLVRREGVVGGLLGLLVVSGVCAVVTWAALHACYLFHAGAYDAVKHPLIADGLLASIARLPGGGTVLSLLPDPFVRGIDLQMGAGRGFVNTLVFDSVRPGHWAYYVVALGVTSPLPLLVLLVTGVFWRGRRWPRHARVLIAAALVVPLAYLSLGTPMQIGVRYVLPGIALLCLIGGHAAAPWPRYAMGRFFIAVLGIWLVLGSALHWPHYIGAFNTLAGPGPYRLYGDSTLAWEHNPDLSEDLALLEKRYPAAKRVYFSSGARIGTSIAYGLDLWPQIGAKPGPVRHWLRGLQPIDRCGAFYVFDASPEVLSDLDDRAVALMGAGRFDEVEEEGLGVEVHAQLLRLRQSRPPADLGAGWFALGRFDRILADGQATTLERARAHHARRENRECRHLLEREEAQLSLDGRLLLSLAHFHLGDFDAAIKALESVRPPAGTAGRAVFDERLQFLQEVARENRRLEEAVGQGGR
jgi:hypothetical protein